MKVCEIFVVYGACGGYVVGVWWICGGCAAGVMLCAALVVEGFEGDMLMPKTGQCDNFSVR